MPGQTPDANSADDLSSNYVQAAHFAAVVSIAGETINCLKDDGALLCMYMRVDSRVFCL